MKQFMVRKISASRSVFTAGVLFVITGPGVLAAPIHDAVLAGDLEQVTMLAQAEVDINAKNAGETTALYMATIKQNVEIIRVLIDNGADTNLSESILQISPLHIAAKKGNKDIANLLILNGADVNAKTNSGTTPLHFASRAGHTELVDLLVANGADVNSRDAEDYTPLHNATFNGYMELTKLLLANGADINATTYNGDTPLHCAQNGDHEEVAALIETVIAAQ
jgi:ankyrin repeat protein